MPEHHTGSPADSAATRIALTAARALTSYEDDRIPERFPEAADRVALLGSTISDYAQRAYDQATVHTWQSRARVAMTNTHAANDLMRVLTAYGQAATGDMRPAETMAEELLLAVLSWKLATGSAARALESTVVALAAHEAGRRAAFAPHGAERDEAIRRFNDANAELKQHHTDDPAGPLDTATRAKAAVGWLFTQLAQDAYSLGLALLTHGDLHRARRWLTFARLHGISEAGPLVPSLSPAGDDEDDDQRIDFDVEPQRWRARADIANKTAAFYPADDATTTTDPDPDDAVPLPCVEIAGVQCYFYLDGDTGAFTVSLDLETAEPWVLTGADLVPIHMKVGGETVYDA